MGRSARARTSEAASGPAETALLLEESTRLGLRGGNDTADFVLMWKRSYELGVAKGLLKLIGAVDESPGRRRIEDSEP
jgi:hypothetical protein